MKIVVTSGSGTGETTLAAFDAALQDAGIDNFNLIKLSSIIPPNSELVIEKYTASEDSFGHRLYTVLAESRSDKVGEVVGAGVAWYQWGDRRGVFAEHHEVFSGKNEKESKDEVARVLESTVRELCKTRKIEFEKENFHPQISAKEVKDKPLCTLIAAVYEEQGWK